ncbi:Protein Pbdc1 [Manis pentadactyla]|nr:Protein Pbdc1 [Manis pentadactyla]
MADVEADVVCSGSRELQFISMVKVNYLVRVMSMIRFRKDKLRFRVGVQPDVKCEILLRLQLALVVSSGFKGLIEDAGYRVLIRLDEGNGQNDLVDYGEQ